MPAFAEAYGLKPWEIVGDGMEALTFGEIDEFADRLRKQSKAIERAQREAKKGR